MTNKLARKGPGFLAHLANRIDMWIVLFAVSLIPGLSSAGAPYEGYGAVTQGALSSPTGYTTYRVTSLANSGPGTLRDAVSQGSRLVVFDVGGVIRLTSDLNIFASYLTIDGSTAPAPGITIEQPGAVDTVIYGRSGGRTVHDVIIRHLRMDGLSPGVATGEGDLWGMDGEDGDVYNVILDHITAVATKDGAFDIYGRVYNVTISWNFIKDSEAALHLSREEDIMRTFPFTTMCSRAITSGRFASRTTAAWIT